MNSKEIIFSNFKEAGGFPEFKNYEEYKNRGKKTEKESLPKKIIENRKKAEEIQNLKANYNPPPTDPKELEKYEEEQRVKANEDWKREHLITEHDKEMYKGLNDGTLKEQEVIEKKLTKKELEEKKKIDEDNDDTKANFNKFIKNNNE